jgi:hypothetical protein
LLLRGPLTGRSRRWTPSPRAQSTLGPAEAIREERRGLQRRIEQLEHDVCQARDELVERVLASDPRGDASCSASAPSSTRAR